MSLEKKILSLLSDGRFHSGSSLGTKLGVSRTAVWKSIQQISELYDLSIQAVQGRGYRLEQPLELLDQQFITQHLTDSAHQALSGLELHWSIDSTNARLMSRQLTDLPSGYALLAEHQTAGRGRRGRHWVSPFAQNLYLSLLWHFSLAPAQLAGLSLAVAVAISRALQRAAITDIQLKWPNDLLWQGRKLCGVLLEMHGEAAGPSSVVVGIGLNIAMDSRADADIEQPWVDLQQVTSRPVSRNAIAAYLLDALLDAMPDYEKHGLAAFIDDWHRLDMSRDQPVDLMFPDRVVSGVARGIDTQGALLLEHEGKIQAYYAGEVSLRSRVKLAT